MKASELMIGDYVNYRGQIIKVTSLYDKGGSNEVGWSDKESVWVNGRCIEPIPLTAEILEKNGFRIEEEYDEIYDIHNYYATLNSVDSEKRNVEVNYRTFGNEITIFCHDRQNVLLCRSLETQIKHVHELQHIFKILKIDKEIVL